MPSSDEHIMDIPAEDLARLRSWLAQPEGSLALGRAITFDAADGGGVLVRTRLCTTHLDSDGLVRTPNQWGFNSFASQEDARKSVKKFGRRGTTWYIFRLADGTFTWAAHQEPSIPGFPAEMVEEVTIR